MKNETTLGGVVYFAQCRDAVKIGYTAGNPADRVSTLQTGCPWPIWLLGSIPSPMAGEALLHNALAGARLRGEWFSVIDAMSLLHALNMSPRLVWDVIWVDGSPTAPLVRPLAIASICGEYMGKRTLQAKVIAGSESSALSLAHGCFEGASRPSNRRSDGTAGAVLICEPINNAFHLFDSDEDL